MVEHFNACELNYCKFLPTATILTQAIILSHLDYNNNLLTGHPTSNLFSTLLLK